MGRLNLLTHSGVSYTGVMRAWVPSFVDELKKIAGVFDDLFMEGVKTKDIKVVGEEGDGDKLYTFTPKGRKKKDKLLKRISGS